MAILGKPQGIFDLNNSDISVGSFLLRHDICEILQVSDADLSSIKFKNIDGLQTADERTIQKAWYAGRQPACPDAGSTRHRHSAGGSRGR